MNETNICIGTVFMTIPIQYNDIYEKILLLFSEYGLEAIKDCKVSCKDKTSHIVDCFNIFASGVAAWNAERYKEANLIMNYLRGQLEIYYPNKVSNNETIYLIGFDKDEAVDEITVDLLKDNNIEVKSVHTKYIVNVNVNSELYVITKEELNAGEKYNPKDNRTTSFAFEKKGTISINDESFNIYKPNINFSGSSYVLNIL